MSATATTTTTTEIELEAYLSSSLNEHDPKTNQAEARVLEVIEETNAAPTPNDHNDTEYPTGSRFYLICLAITLVLILGGVDNSIVSTAVPSISDHFHTVRCSV